METEGREAEIVLLPGLHGIEQGAWRDLRLKYTNSTVISPSPVVVDIVC